MKPSLLHKRQAFSLVEITISLGIMAFCLLALFGLLPVGLTSNQISVEQTGAASVADGIAADLFATPKTVATTVRYAIPISASGKSQQVLFLRKDGSSITNGPATAAADPSKSPFYRATLQFAIPTTASLGTETSVRIWVTWPAMVDRTPGVAPKNYTGSFDTVINLSRK